MNLFIVIIIAISLSMDAFSLALSLGTLAFKRKTVFCLSLLVSLFHFFMPLLGTILGAVFVEALHIDVHLLSFSIFFYIAIVMFKDFKNGEEVNFKLSLLGAIIFAIGVSLDSFGVGVALQLRGFDIVKSFLIFSLASFSFTYLGLCLGKVLNELVGRYSVLGGSMIMSLLALFNFLQIIF